MSTAQTNKQWNKVRDWQTLSSRATWHSEQSQFIAGFSLHGHCWKIPLYKKLPALSFKLVRLWRLIMKQIQFPHSFTCLGYEDIHILGILSPLCCPYTSNENGQTWGSKHEPPIKKWDKNSMFIKCITCNTNLIPYTPRYKDALSFPCFTSCVVNRVL